VDDGADYGAGCDGEKQAAEPPGGVRIADVADQAEEMVAVARFWVAAQRRLLGGGSNG